MQIWTFWGTQIFSSNCNVQFFHQPLFRRSQLNFSYHKKFIKWKQVKITNLILKRPEGLVLPEMLRSLWSKMSFSTLLTLWKALPLISWIRLLLKSITLSNSCSLAIPITLFTIYGTRLPLKIKTSVSLGICCKGVDFW